MTDSAVLRPPSFVQQVMQKELIRQMARFMSVGFINLALSLAIFHFSSEQLRTVVLNADYRLLTANAIAFAVTVTTAFLLNSRITFREKQADLAAYCRYGVVTLVGFGLNNLLLLAFVRVIAAVRHETVQQMVDGFRPGKTVAFLGAVGCVFFWNFFMSRNWVFRPAATGTARTIVRSHAAANGS